ncbi:UDP-N-acetylglucosamine 4,6-dehydratase family protein [Saccharibacillus sp. JS10]|uniref:UDP-N-acetylglucosamine 4,6-dehydratase family protein n=1 Tax=Saccharibacillus sp. JS10 TaxID=2950552 RepID=UPI0021094068|nr:UDP-N-acetylglucosamine 4,6-dehydratase family protein [Saccharibacillus sp. JS10]MCQ4088813.1 polysaccharide biosynthesis protein [Saccharibacillus sp. JS10]
MKHSLYQNKKILIIGGTGTIGQHLTRCLLEEHPQVIRIFSRDEHKQYEMGLNFHSEREQLRFLIGDVRDSNRLSRAMEGIDYVFHCAAMKHVPACEYNPFEAVQTNVLGTQNVIQNALSSHVKKVLFISTDKAISPTNTYGATKLLAEKLISATELNKGPNSTVFSAVRFGNVMGSRGSVIPLFKKQILEQGEITITDPDMLRYMMTPGQAIKLILKANELATGGEVFVLKMPVVRIEDLANVMIKELSAKYDVNRPVRIKQIGLRPGEKRFEELMTEDEVEYANETEDMYIIFSQYRKKENLDGETGAKCINKPVPLMRDIISKEEILDWIIKEKLI